MTASKLGGMHRRLISIAFSAVAAAVVAGVLLAGGTGASAAPAKKGTAFRQVLAAKLGAQLDKPAGDVLAALKTAAKANKPQRAKREKLSKAERAKRREAAQARKKAWAESMAKSLDVEPAAVTAAVQALVKERLDSLVEDGWLTAEQRDQRLSAGKLGVGFLRLR
jgi:uncharacterized protein YaiL (DUF2058 family)